MGEEDVEELGNSIGPVGKVCANRWNALSENEKAPYQKAAEKEFAKYRTKMEKYKNAPKRPLSAYMLFSADNRDEVTEEVGSASDVTVIAKKLGQRWANASEDDKAEYQAQAADLKVDYEEDLAKYKKSKKYADYQEKLAAWKLSNKQTAKPAKVVRRRR